MADVKSPPPGSASEAERMSDGEKFMDDLKYDYQSVAVLAVILSGVLTLVLFFLFFRQRLASRGRVVALLGTCESGKTAMFARLLHDKGVETCTSSTENRGVHFPADGKAALEVVDVPGHVRIRQRGLDDAKRVGLRAVVYVVDAACLQKQLRDVAEFLFAVLSDKVVAESGVDVMVACNKQDLPLAKGSAVIRRELEREFQLLITSQSRSLGGTGGDSGTEQRISLGQEGKDFSFDDLNNNVSFEETSSISDDGLQKLKEFLSAVA